jgi:hypothetical protein
VAAKRPIHEEKVRCADVDVAVDALVGVPAELIVRPKTKDVTLLFFDGAASAFGFDPPHCTVSNPLTKPEIGAIGSLHRESNCKGIRGEMDGQFAHMLRKGRIFLFESALTHWKVPIRKNKR